MRYQATSLDASQPLSPSSLQTEQTHPSALPLARLSRNALLALTQVEAQPDPHHQLFALLAYNGIADGALHIHSSKLTEAEYRQQVAVPNAGPANLTVQAKLNEHSQYDIVRITLDVLSTGGTESILLMCACSAHKENRSAPNIRQSICTGLTRPVDASINTLTQSSPLSRRSYFSSCSVQHLFCSGR